MFEGTSLQIVATYYGASSPAGVGFELTCATGADLNLVSGAPQAADRRHDAVKLLIQVADRATKSLSTITVSLGCVGSELTYVLRSPEHTPTDRPVEISSCAELESVDLRLGCGDADQLSSGWPAVAVQGGFHSRRDGAGCVGPQDGALA